MSAGNNSETPEQDNLVGVEAYPEGVVVTCPAYDAAKHMHVQYIRGYELVAVIRKDDLTRELYFSPSWVFALKDGLGTIVPAIARIWEEVTRG